VVNSCRNDQKVTVDEQTYIELKFGYLLIFCQLMAKYPIHKYFTLMTEYCQNRIYVGGKRVSRNFFIITLVLGYLYVLLFENQVSLSYCPRQNIQTAGLDFLPAEN